MLDVVDAVRQRPLIEGDDTPGHIVGRQAREAENHADDGDVDVRENVGWRSQSGSCSKNQDQHRHDDERVWPSQGQPNDSNHSILPPERVSVALAADH